MPHLKNYAKEERPWGIFERFTLNEATSVKVVAVNPGEAISLQRHGDRDEFWRVLAGSGIITIGAAEHSAAPGQDYYTPRGSAHRIAAGPEGLALLEIAFGNFDEGDITRLEDRYGRA